MSVYGTRSRNDEKSEIGRETSGENVIAVMIVVCLGLIVMLLSLSVLFLLCFNVLFLLCAVLSL